MTLWLIWLGVPSAGRAQYLALLRLFAGTGAGGNDAAFTCVMRFYNVLWLFARIVQRHLKTLITFSFVLLLRCHCQMDASSHLLLGCFLSKSLWCMALPMATKATATAVPNVFQSIFI